MTRAAGRFDETSLCQVNRTGSQVLMFGAFSSGLTIFGF